MVLVDIRETPSAKAADIFLQIRPGKDFEVLTALRALVKGQPVNEAAVAETGLTHRAAAGPGRPDEAGPLRRHLLRHGPVDDARQAHELGRRADAGRRDERLHQVRRHADARPRQRHRLRHGACAGRPAIRSASTCAAAIRASTRASSRRSTCWSAATSTPRWSWAPIPARRCRSRASTTWPASRRSCSIPKVTHTSRLARVHITTAATGISAPGTVYRMDEIPLPLRPALEVAVSDRRGSDPPHPRGAGRAPDSGTPYGEPVVARQDRLVDAAAAWRVTPPALPQARNNLQIATEVARLGTRRSLRCSASS